MAHNKTLTQLKWFKWALWGPIATAVFFTAIIAIWDNSQQSLDWGRSSAHINDAIGRLKLPLAIASLAFPLVALVASHHRSVQTAAQIARTDQQIARTDKQIEATEQKNAFENCVKHRELFNEFINRLSSRYDFEFEDVDLLYNVIFTENDYRSFSFYADEMSSPRHSKSGSYFHQMIGAFEKFRNAEERYDDGLYSYKEALDEFSELPRLLLYVQNYEGDSIEELYQEDGRFFDEEDVVYPQKISYFIHNVNEIFREFCDFCLSPELAKKYKDSKFLYIESRTFHEDLVGGSSSYNKRFKKF